MPDEAALIDRIRRLALETPDSAGMARQLIEYWAARQDIQVRNRLLQNLVFKYAATEKEFYRLNRELSEKQRRIEEDLAAAAEIQRSLLPRKPAAFDHFDAAWDFQPSAHIGGDLFNVMRLDEHRWGIYALDVSGHGVPAAMVAVSVYQNLQPYSAFVRRAEAGLARGYSLRTPGQVLRLLDREYPFERFTHFFTMVYLMLDVEKRTLVYGNAGHPDPILLRRSGEVERFKRSGPFIGLRSIGARPEKRARYADNTTVFEPGDKLFVYTDGLTEYQTTSGALFGRDRFVEILRRWRQAPVGDIVAAVRASLAEFGDGRAPVDDVTLLGIELKPRLTS
jgi:sigma-B regulation protein RsbU (phosphoserine phosphatase)